MYTPLLAAGAVALMIASAPMTTPKLLDALDVSEIFEPLTCAMAHSGSCFLPPDDTASHKAPHAPLKRNRPVLAAASLD